MGRERTLLHCYYELLILFALAEFRYQESLYMLNLCCYYSSPVCRNTVYMRAVICLLLVLYKILVVVDRQHKSWDQCIMYSWWDCTSLCNWTISLSAITVLCTPPLFYFVDINKHVMCVCVSILQSLSITSAIATVVSQKFWAYCIFFWIKISHILYQVISSSHKLPKVVSNYQHIEQLEYASLCRSKCGVSSYITVTHLCSTTGLHVHLQLSRSTPYQASCPNVD